MEKEKNNSKIINVARKYCSLPTTQRLSDVGCRTQNIFHTDQLQRSVLMPIQKNYSCVGINELKQFIRKSKKAQNYKKPNTGSIGISLKSYTIKSNDVQDLMLTREQVLKVIHQTQGNQENKHNKQLKKNKNKSHFIESFHKQPKKNIMTKTMKANQRLNSYDKKIQKLNKYSLNEKKENIQSQKWPKILRTSTQLSQLYRKQQQNLQIIKRNGLTIKARSKKEKQTEWINQQAGCVLYEFIQNSKRRKLQLSKIRQSYQ